MEWLGERADSSTRHRRRRLRCRASLAEAGYSFIRDLPRLLAFERADVGHQQVVAGVAVFARREAVGFHGPRQGHEAIAGDEAGGPAVGEDDGQRLGIAYGGASEGSREPYTGASEGSREPGGSGNV